MSQVVEPLEPNQHNLKEILEEVGTITRERFGAGASSAILSRWKPMLAGGTGFVLLDGPDCVGLLLYSTEYELRFSSFLSDTSVHKLPQNATISVCHVLSRVREHSQSNEQLLLQSAVSRLRLVKLIETIAVQLSPLYELNIRDALARMGFMNCKRVQMQCMLTGEVPTNTLPPGLTMKTPTSDDAEALMSIIYQAYFSEIDGYLFPDIAAVCSDIELFKEFLSSNSIDHNASVIARMREYPCGCVIGLYDEKGRSGLIGVVGVVPSMRRRGVARSMLLKVMRWLQQHGNSRATLAVTCENHRALSLYSSLGFEEAGRRSSISVWRRSVSRPRMYHRR